MDTCSCEGPMQLSMMGLTRVVTAVILITGQTLAPPV